MPSFLSRCYGTAVRRCLGTITEFRTQSLLAALTFDDGPHPDTTPLVLDVLDRYRAKATFFMVGKLAEAEPALVRQVARRGHSVANHSWSHQPLPSLSRTARRREIAACARALRPVGERLFRPPWGQQSYGSRLDALALRHQVIGWNMDVADWQQTDAACMAEQLVTRIRPGSIILLHDHILSPDAANGSALHRNRDAMIQALDRALDELCRTYRFVTLREMAREARPVLRSWFAPAVPSASRA